MRISDWSSDVCSSDLELPDPAPPPDLAIQQAQQQAWLRQAMLSLPPRCRQVFVLVRIDGLSQGEVARRCGISVKTVEKHLAVRSEEHTSELQSLMRISYAVFCLKKKKKHNK